MFRCEIPLGACQILHPKVPYHAFLEVTHLMNVCTSTSYLCWVLSDASVLIASSLSCWSIVVLLSHTFLSSPPLIPPHTTLALLHCLTQSLHQFKLECLNETVKELDRLRTKDSLTLWSCAQTTKDLVSTLDDHIADVNSLAEDKYYDQNGCIAVCYHDLSYKFFPRAVMY